jgi:Immunoglobulin domain
MEPLRLGDRTRTGDFHGLALLRDGSPQITVQPWDREILAGTTVSLTTKAVGLKATTYQWQFNGKIIHGATNDTYTIANAKPVDAGNYSLLASNYLGMVVTRQAALVVSAPSFALSVLGPENKMTISWPSVGTSGLSLEEASSLATPTVWILSAATVSDDGTNKTAAVPVTNSARFFRLVRR